MGSQPDPAAAGRHAIGPARMGVDERQPPGRLLDGLHERLGLVEGHGIARIAVIRLEIERHQRCRPRLGGRKEGRRLPGAGILAGAEMVGTPQQTRALGLVTPHAVRGSTQSPPSVALWMTPRMLLRRRTA